MQRKDTLPICVDLDGTLVMEETLWILLRQLWKRSTLAFFGIVMIYCFKGRAAFKQALSKQVLINPKTLSYHPELLSDLKRLAEEGKTLILATGADIRVAKTVATHLGFFKGVIASQGKQNVVGKVKATILANTFGAGRFIYAGNSWKDLPVWERAAHIMVVNAPPRLLKTVKKSNVKHKHLKAYA